MKIKNKFNIAAFALLFLFNASVSAHLLQYDLSLETTDVEGPAFGGVSVGDEFKGLLAIDTHVLQEVVEEDGGFATVIVPLQDADDNFNLFYTINLGDSMYTEQTPDQELPLALAHKINSQADNTRQTEPLQHEPGNSNYLL
jgi:hypothetical protein